MGIKELILLLIMITILCIVFEAEGSQCSDTLIINTTIVMVKEKEKR